MDDLPNILQDNYGLRPQGKSAPMSSAKKAPPSYTPARSGSSGRPSSRASPSYGVDAGSGFGGVPFKASSAGSGSPYNDDVFGGTPGMGRSSSPFGSDDIFSGPPKAGSQPLNLDDDIFGPPPKSSSSTGLYGMGGPSSDLFGSDDVFGMGKSSVGGGGSSGNLSGNSSRTYSATASAFDDLLGSGSFDATAKPKSKSRSRSSSTTFGEDLLGGFSAESSSPSSRKKGERSKASSATPAADPFAGVSVGVDPLFGGMAPPPPTSGFSDPFDPFFVPSTPPYPDPTSGTAATSNGGEGLSGLEAFAKSASASVPEEPPKEKPSRPSREAAEKTEKPKATSRRSGHSFDSPSLEQSQEQRAAPKLGKSSSNASRETRRAAAPEAKNATGLGPQGSQTFKDVQDEVWLTLDDITLKTQPASTPPPNRPPPAVGSQAFPSSKPSRFESPPESSRVRSEPRPEHKADPKVEPEVEPQPPSASSRYAPRRPSHQSGEQAPRNYDFPSGGRAPPHSGEQAPRNFDHSSGGLEGLDDFVTGGRHRRRPPEGKQPTPPRNQPEAVPGDGMDGLDDFASGGGSRRRQAVPETKADGSPRRERSERRRESGSESGSRSAHDMNDSAEAAEQSAAAMKEVLERAKLKAEAARRAREQERERERQEMEAAREASSRARAKAAEAQQEARAKAEAEARAQAQRQTAQNDLDSFFSGAAQQTKSHSEPRQRPTEKGPTNLDDLGARKSRQPEPVKRTPSAPTPASADGWADILGGANVQVPLPSEAPIPGESDERRKLRLERERRTAERAAEALREKNRRDADAAREQVERDRAGDTLDTEIKKWAAGKQGNIRALLSTLQYVLWPECKWEAVPLTDLMSGAAVKKAYRKATLCVHPDKVQQKGASIQQKYIAEKVFDLLKEAWNKFNSEELF